MIINLGDAWPYPRVADSRQAGSKTWFVVAECHADQLLGCVPPIYPRGVPGFFVGEPASHDERGVAIHALVAQRGDLYFMREVARDQALVAYGELLGLLR